MDEQYEKIYIRFTDYIGENFTPSMVDTAIHAEQLTEIVKEEIEEAILEAE